MQRKIPRRAVDGVLLLDKPVGMTSNGALQTARRLFNAAKAGHTGTLDPMAGGLLPLTFGEATKFSQMLLDADKGYEAEVLLGVATDTGDADGRVIERETVSFAVARIEAAAAGFRGEIEQVPPMYSALKRDGKPLYEYARAGIEVERKARRVTIHRLELLDVGPDRFRMRVDCSKGTYVRTLAMDIGRALGCGAHLTALRRVRIGPFGVEQAVRPEAIESLAAEARDSLLAPVDALLAHLPVLTLGADDAFLLTQGRNIACGAEDGLVRAYGPAGFLGLGEVVDRRLQPKRLKANGAGA